MVAFDLVSKLFIKLDVLAPGMHMNIKGGYSIRTWLGVFISLIYVAGTSYAVSSQIMDYLDTTHPFVAAELKLNTIYPSIDLPKNRHVPVLFAFSSTTSTLTFEEMKKYFTFKYRQYIYVMQDGSHTFDLKIDELPTMACRELIENGKLNTEDYKNLGGYLDLLPDFGACVDPTGYNLTVVGSNSDPYEKFGYLEIFPCMLTNGQCKTKAQINNIWLQIVKPAVGMDLSNATHPIRYEANLDDFYVLNTDSSQFYLQQLIMNKITDSYGFLIPDKEIVTYTTYDPPLFSNGWRNGAIIKTTQAEIDKGLVNAYFTFEWCSGMKFNRITRTYGGFLDYLGNIGGINSIIWLVCFAIYFAWHSHQEKLEMVHAVYGLKKAKSKGCCTGPFSCCKKKLSPTPIDKKLSVLGFDLPGVLASQSTIKSTNKDNKPAQVEGGTIFVSPEVIDEAYDNIKATLDLVTICREVNVIRYLSSVLLKDYQKGLIPLASLSKSMQEKRDRQEKERLKRQLTANPLFKALANFASDLPKEEADDDIQAGVTTLMRKIEGGDYDNKGGEDGEGYGEQYGEEYGEPKTNDLVSGLSLRERSRAKTLIMTGTTSPILKGFEEEFNSNFYTSITRVAPILGIENMISHSPHSGYGTRSGSMNVLEVDRHEPPRVSKFKPNVIEPAMKKSNLRKVKKMHASTIKPIEK